MFTPPRGQHDVLGERPPQAAQAYQSCTCPIWGRLDSEATSTDVTETAQATAESPGSPSEPLVVKDVVRPHPLSHIISMSGLPQWHLIKNGLRGWAWQGKEKIGDIDILMQWLYDKTCEVNRVNTADSKNWLDVADECFSFLASTRQKYIQRKQTDSARRITDKLIEFANDPDFHALLRRLKPAAATSLSLTKWLKTTGEAGFIWMGAKAIARQAPPSTSTCTTKEAGAPAASERNSSEAHSVNRNPHQGEFSDYLPRPEAFVTPQQPNNVDAQFYPGVISAFTPPPKQQHVPGKPRLHVAEASEGGTRAASRRRDLDPTSTNAPGQAKAPQAPPEDPRPRQVPEKRRRQSAKVSEGGSPAAKRRRLGSDATSTNVPGQAETTQAPAEDLAPLPERPVVNDAVLSKLSRPLAEIISMDGFPAPQQVIGRLQRWQKKSITEIDILIYWLYDKSGEANRENTAYSRQWLDTVMYGVLAFLARTRGIFQSTRQQSSAERMSSRLIQLADAPDFHALLLHTMSRMQKEGNNHLGITRRLKEMRPGAVAQTDRTASAQHVHEAGISISQHPDFNRAELGLNGGMEAAQALERTLQLPERRPDDNTLPPAALPEIIRAADTVNQFPYQGGFSEANTSFETGNAYAPEWAFTETAHDANEEPYQEEFSYIGANFGAGAASHQDWALAEDLLAGNIYLSQLPGGDDRNG